MHAYIFLHFFIEVSLAPDCFDTEDTQVDPITVVAAVVVLILVVAVVVVILMVGVRFDPFSIMICKQSAMEINPPIARYIAT